MIFLKSGLLTILLSAAVSGQQFADLVIVNARVRTMDEKKPVAVAIAIAGERIIVVGTDREVRAAANAKTKVIDAGGKLVIPGFNDAHVHFTGVGNWFSHLDANGVSTTEELQRKISRFTNFLPKGRWIIGARLDLSKWKGSPPTFEQLDAVSPDNPILLYLADPSSAAVNSATVRKSGSQKTENPVVSGATLVRIRNAIPANHGSNWDAITEAASNYAASLGVTSVQDVHSDNLLATYSEMAAAGRLKTRVYDCVGLESWEKGNVTGFRVATEDSIVRGGCVKWFSGGASEERAELGERIARADKAGLQVMVHAIGGESNKNTIDAFEFAASKNGAKDRRFRIEHAHLMRTADMARLARLKIIPSMQPALFFREGDGGGDDFGRIMRSGVWVAFGSDASMIDIDPLLGIYAAVNSGKGSVTVEQAVKAYTLGSAYAEFQEKEKGSLSVGKLADMVILSEDIFKIAPAKIRYSKVVMTVLGGKIIYEAGVAR